MDNFKISSINNNSNNLDENRAQKISRNDIILSILNDKMNVFFQPIYNSKSNKIDYYECFIRLNHNEQVILPKYFIPEIENSRMMQLITLKVFEEIYKFFSIEKSKMTISNGNKFSFGVNLSKMDLEYSENVEYYLKLFYDRKFIDRVIFEVPLNVGFENISLLKKELIKINGNFALDNIKVCEEHLDYISFLKPNLIKINSNDLSQNNILDRYNEKIKKIGVKKIATFIQSNDLLNLAKNYDMESLQGFLLSKPINKISIKNIE